VAQFSDQTGRWTGGAVTGWSGREGGPCTIAIDSPVYSTFYCIPGFDSSGQLTMRAGDITTFSDMAASSWRQAGGRS
jgi:hypothetical protein